MVGTAKRGDAQAFQGNITGVTGSVSRSTGTNSETLTIGSSSATINWSPTGATNGTVDFLPQGNTATFLGTPGLPDFTVLNRINTNQQVALNGRVVSQLQDASQNVTTGGKVWFYAPGGIVVGANAVFDVGGLLLTANDPVSFSASSGGFSGSFQATTDSNPLVAINAGAQINATADNSYVAIVAPRIDQSGTINVNGSAALVAAEGVTLTMNQGLFDIVVDVGTTDSAGIIHTGSTGGPASSGAGDNHHIYMVAVPKNQALTAFLTGSIGFAPAVNASVENGAIVLSAGYNVHGDAYGTADEGQDLYSGSGGSDGMDPVGAGLAEMHIDTGTYTSDLVGRASHNIFATGVDGSTTFTGDVTLIGRDAAHIGARFGHDVTIGGDATVTSGMADDYADRSSLGGQALMYAEAGSTLTIGGNATVDTSVRGATNEGGIGGSSTIHANGGTIDIGGDVTVSANGYGGGTTAGQSGATGQGGQAILLSSGGGDLHVGGNAFVNATALSGINQAGGTASTSYGGGAQILAHGGDISVGASVGMAVHAFGGTISNGGTAGTGVGGTGIVDAAEGGAVTVTGGLTIGASGHGGTVDGGSGNGGSGVGGDALVVGSGGSIAAGSILLDARGLGSAAGTGGGNWTGGSGHGGFANIHADGPGSIAASGSTTLSSNGFGGNGRTGGAGFGGNAGVYGTQGSVSLGSTVGVYAIGVGGNASSGFGGSGGSGEGGSAYIEALASVATVENPATALSITGGSVTLDVSGTGGAGGAGDGGNIAAGSGGDGIGGAYQGELGSGGAFAAAQADGATLQLANVTLTSNGTGGTGGAGGTGQVGGAGGQGLGGTVQAGQYNSVTGQPSGSAAYTSVTMQANGFGGAGGTGAAGSGNGGLAEGGAAFFLARSSVSAASLNLAATATGGAGATGGEANGGLAELNPTAGAIMTVTNGVTLDSAATGGAGSSGLGGIGTAGTVGLAIDQGASLTIGGGLSARAIGTGGDGQAGGGAAFGGEVNLVANGNLNTGGLFANARAAGGHSTGNGAGGAADAGSASLEAWGGSVAIAGVTNITANALGGNGQLAGGQGTGGSAGADAGEGGSITFSGDTSITANGFGGNSTNATGGAGYGGDSAIDADVGGTISAAFAMLQSGGIGGSGLTGGEAHGGTTDLSVEGSFSADQVVMLARANGGNGTAAGGGTAWGGVATLEVEDGTAQVTGSTDMIADAVGGSGVTLGGDANAGWAGIDLFEGTANFGGSLLLTAEATGGAASAGTAGTLRGGDTVIDLWNSSLTGKTVTLDAGGDVGGSATVDLYSSTMNVDALTLDASGTVTGGEAALYAGADTSVGSIINTDAYTAVASGGSSGGIAYLAISGDSTANLGAATMTATGGPEGGGGIFVYLGGSGGGDLAGVDGLPTAAFGDAVLNAQSLQMTSGSVIQLSSTGGASVDVAGTLGAHSTIVDFLDQSGGATIEAGSLDIDALSFTSNFGMASDIISLSSDVDLSVGDLFAGQQIILSAGGNLSTGSLEAGQSISLTAVGDINAGHLVTGTVTADAGGNLYVHNVDATSEASFEAGGLAYFEGLVSAPEISVRSADIEIDGQLGEIGVTNLITLTAVSDGAPVILGGEDQIQTEAESGYQYILSDEEEIAATSIIVNAVASEGGVGPDVLVRDLEIDGDGVNSVNLNTTGKVLVEGEVLFANTDSSDLLSIDAASILVDRDQGGFIALFTGGEGAEVAQGRLLLTADDIWIGDSALLSNLSENQNFEGRDAALATSTGEDSRFGHLVAGAMELTVADSLLVQNSGDAASPGGLTVGDGGLSIRTGPTPATVVAYGQQLSSNGQTTGGEDFFNEVDFGKNQGATYTAASTFNGCGINAGCGSGPVDDGPGAPPDEATGSGNIMGPVGIPQFVAVDFGEELFGGGTIGWVDEDGEGDDDGSPRMGIPLSRAISNSGNATPKGLDDAVTSGGDASLWMGVDDEDGDSPSGDSKE